MDAKQNNSGGNDNGNSPRQQNGNHVGANGNGGGGGGGGGGAPNDGNQNGNNGMNGMIGMNGGDNNGPFIIDPASLTSHPNPFVLDL